MINRSLARTVILITTIAIYLNAPIVQYTHAVEPVAATSATLSSASAESTVKAIERRNFQIRKLTIQKVLATYKSPLIPYSEIFVKTAATYRLDPYLVVSISGLESTFGRHMLHGTYNAWGWGGGTIALGSWENGIETVSQALRENYYNRGAVTLADIGRKYAESKTWTPRVDNFMQQFYNTEWKIRRMSGVILTPPQTQAVIHTPAIGIRAGG